MVLRKEKQAKRGKDQSSKNLQNHENTFDMELSSQKDKLKEEILSL